MIVVVPAHRLVWRHTLLNRRYLVPFHGYVSYETYPLSVGDIVMDKVCPNDGDVSDAALCNRV